MGYVFLVRGGKEMGSLDFIIDEFEVDEIVILSKEDDKIDPKIDSLKVKKNALFIKGDIWEEIFRIVQSMRKTIGSQNLIVGPIESCDDLSQALINAGFVNGLKILSENNGEISMLPLFKFTAYKELTEKKLEIVNLLYENPENELNLETIGKHTKMSPPLVSYHINGNIKSEGLKELGLVISREDHGKSFVKLTKLGILIIKGYLQE